MLNLDFFQSLAEYANNTWKGAYSSEEVKENANIYFSDYNFCIENKIILPSVIFLCKNLAEDGTMESLEFASKLLDGIIKEISRRSK